MSRMIESTEYVRRIYTVDERLKMADELAAAHNKLADIKKDKEVVVSQFKEKQLQVEQRVEQLSRSLGNGFEMANIKCRIDYDKPNMNEVQYVRMDTGEVVKTRAMLPDEMQEELPLGDERSDDAAEQVVEASQEAADEFFKPGRPTEPPTAETAAPIPEVDGSPSAEDLDAVAAEQQIASTTAPADGLPWEPTLALLEKHATITAGLLQKHLDVSYVVAVRVLDRLRDEKLITAAGAKIKVSKPRKSGPKELAAEHASQPPDPPSTTEPAEEVW